MPTKSAPLGVCDLCGGPIPPHLGPYTKHGQPRRYCSRDCRNTANSRAGNPARVAKLRRAVERGEWQNPATIHPPDPEEQARRARLGRLREVEAGTWRNPALDDAAREKLSRPRKHSGPLHQAIEKMGRGLKMGQLTPDEQIAYRAYNRERRARWMESKTAEERQEMRRKWREVWHRHKKK